MQIERFFLRNTLLQLLRYGYAAVAMVFVPFLVNAANPVCSTYGPAFRAEKDGRVVVLFGANHQGTLAQVKTTRAFAEKWMDGGSRILYTENGTSAGTMPHESMERIRTGPRALAVFDEHPYEKSELINRYGERIVNASRIQLYYGLMEYVTIERFSLGEGRKLEYSTESILTEFAQKHGFPVRAIETTEDADVIEAFPIEVLYRYAKAILPRRIMHESGSLPLDTPGYVLLADEVERWASGDVDLCASIREEREKTILAGNAEPLEYQFVAKRNHLMVDKIDGFIAQASPNPIPIVAVGAAHLGGREGILNLLRQRGYTISCA